MADLQRLAQALQAADAAGDTQAATALAQEIRRLQGGAVTHDGLPARQNADGSYSTEVSITVTDPRLNGGRPTNIPSLWGGQELDEDSAVQAALGSGRNWQSFPSIEAAVSAARSRSEAGGAGAPRVTRDSLRASNPGEYDPSSPEYRQKYGTGGLGAILKDVGRNIVRAPVTAADATLNVGRQAVAAPVAGVAGILATPANLIPGVDDAGARTVEAVQGFIGGQPFTERGRQVMDAAAYIPGKVEQVTDWAGQKAANVTGSPAVGAGVKTVLSAAPALLTRGRLGRGNIPANRPARAAGAGEAEAGASAPAQAQRGRGLEPVPRAASRQAAPSIDELRAAKNAAYKAAEDAGVTVSGRDMTRFKVELVKDMQEKRLNKKLHPDSYEAVQEILRSPNEITLTQLDQLRQLVGDARMAPKKADAWRASRIIEHIDKLEDGLTGNHPGFKEARALNQRLAKAETIERVFQSAKRAVGANYTVAGMETALRQKFRSLIENDKKMRGFTAEERAAIDSFISGGKADNFLRKVGKFAPDGTISGWTAILASMANPALAIVPAAGSVAKFASSRRGIKNANKISEMVRGNPLSAPPSPRNRLAELYTQ